MPLSLSTPSLSPPGAFSYVLQAAPRDRMSEGPAHGPPVHVPRWDNYDCRFTMPPTLQASRGL